MSVWFYPTRRGLRLRLRRPTQRSHRWHEQHDVVGEASRFRNEVDLWYNTWSFAAWTPSSIPGVTRLTAVATTAPRLNADLQIPDPTPTYSLHRLTASIAGSTTRTPRSTPGTPASSDSAASILAAPFPLRRRQRPFLEGDDRHGQPQLRRPQHRRLPQAEHQGRRRSDLRRRVLTTA